MTTNSAAGSSLVPFLRLLRRRMLLVLLPPLVLLALALAHSFSQGALYQGQADVLLSRVNLQSMIENQPVASIEADEFFQIKTTQATLAQTPLLARRVLAQADVNNLTPRQFLDRASVEPDRAQDLLHFRVEDPNPSRAQRLSDIFAEEYVTYRRQLDTTSIKAARARILQTLKGLQPEDPGTEGLVRSLTDKEQQLRTAEALQAGNVTKVPTGATVSKVRPRTTRDAIIAVLLGLIAGVGLAYLREALDTRVRTPEEVSDFLHLPFLGYLEPPRKGALGELPMIGSPSSIAAESFRMLALNLDFANFGPKARSIMISSAVDEEGKSVTIANLAVAFARSGRHVALVDFDLRKPTLHTLFGLDHQNGITDVILAGKPLSEVGNIIELSDGNSRRPQPGGDGGLVVFPAGTLPPNPGEFLSSPEVGDLIQSLSAYEYLLVDAPPLLQFGDPLILSGRIDAMFLVVRLGVARKPVLRELERALQNVPVSLLGVAATGSGAWLKTHGYGVPAESATPGNGLPMPVDPQRASLPSPRE